MMMQQQEELLKRRKQQEQQREKLLESRAQRIAEMMNTDVKKVEETLMQNEAKKKNLGGGRFDSVINGGVPTINRPPGGF